MSRPLTPRMLLFRVVAAVMLLALIMFLCSLVGPQDISLREAIGRQVNPSLPNPSHQILVHFRIPRVLLAAMVGAALAASGVTLQALLRNPLADPYILGISSGAGLGAVLAIVSGFSWTLWGRSPVAVFAFVGALGTVWLVWVIGRLTGKYHTTGLLLAGVVVNAFFSALILFLVSIAKSQEFQATMFWLMGNMIEEDFLVLWIGGGSIVAGTVALFFLSPQLNIISVGRQDARSIGVSVERTELAAFAVSAFITATAVSMSGLIGFVGLIVPHAIRLVFGPDHRQLLPLSSLAGAMFLAVADTIARTIVAPAQLPVGVVTAMIGGPFFLILLIRFSRKVYCPA